MERPVAEHGADSLVGTLLDGRYLVGPVLARGGMSTVYRGQDARLDRPVALKVMEPGFSGDPTFLERFEREARAAARVRHPSVVDVHDAGMDRDGPLPHVYLVMELVDGGTLRDLLRARGPLPVPLALSIAEPVLAALAAAHREGLIHRDVKPENILIGRDGAVKIGDFGLVRAVAEARTTSASVILGTVAYLSPEQVATGEADPRSDVYAMGIVLYEMLTGAPPYTGDTAISVAYRHVNDDVPVPDVPMPPLLEELLVAATRRDPESRPVDAGDFLLALRRIREMERIPPVAVPVPHGEIATRTPGAYHGPRGTRAMMRDEPSTAYIRSEFDEPTPPPPPYEPVTDRYDPRRGRRAFWLWAALVLLLAAAIGTTAWWFGSGRYADVPQVGGLELAAADAKLDDAGFDTKAVQDHHDTVPEGIVIGTDPDSGERAVKGSEIDIIVSQGRPVVPDIKSGTTRERALQILADADLVAGPDDAAQAFDDTAPPGTVVDVRPAPGTQLTVGSEVTLVLSQGPAPTEVPDVRGRTEADARAILLAAGLDVRRVEQLYDEDVAAGRVIRTDPEAGSETNRGESVALVVSTALVVPDVVGMPRVQALATLREAGFDPRERGEGRGKDRAVVESLDPKAGSLVNPRDSRVDVTMVERVTVPNVIGQSVAEARKELEDAGLKVDVASIFGEGSIVVGQDPADGRQVTPGSRVRIIAP